MTEPVSAAVEIAPPAMTPVAPVSTPVAPVPADVITDLEAFREQGLEAMGSKGISFQPGGPGTEVFTVPHALLLEDDQHEALTHALSTPAIARVLLNTPDDEDVYERFKAAGGRSGDILMAWRRLGEGLGAPKQGKR